MEILLPNFWKVGTFQKHRQKKALNRALFFFLFLLAFSCSKPDETTFSERLQVDAYLFNAYQGQSEFYLEEEYGINYSEITEVSTISIDRETGAQVALHGAVFGEYSFGVQDTVIVVFSGGYGHLDYYYSRIKLLKSMSPNFKVIFFDYQGIGRSEGQFSFGNMQLDAEAILRWVKSRTQNCTVAFYVCGLGSIAFMPLNLENDTSFWIQPKVILENPVATSEFLVSGAVQFNLPISYSGVPEIDLISVASEQKGMFLMLLSELDERIDPKDHGQVLFEELPQNKTLLQIEEAGHHTIPLVEGFSTYNSILYDFLSN